MRTQSFQRIIAPIERGDLKNLQGYIPYHTNIYRVTLANQTRPLESSDSTMYIVDLYFVAVEKQHKSRMTTDYLYT